MCLHTARRVYGPLQRPATVSRLETSHYQLKTFYRETIHHPDQESSKEILSFGLEIFNWTLTRQSYLSISYHQSAVIWNIPDKQVQVLHLHHHHHTLPFVLSPGSQPAHNNTSIKEICWKRYLSLPLEITSTEPTIHSVPSYHSPKVLGLPWAETSCGTRKCPVIWVDKSVNREKFLTDRVGLGLLLTPHSPLSHT